MSVASGLILACLLLESAFWVFDLQPARALTKRLLVKNNHTLGPRYDCYPTNPNGEFQPLPDTAHGDWSLFVNAIPPSELPLARLRETPWCVEYSRSDLTLRDPDYTEFAPLDVLRMAMFGDSFVFGEGVPIEKSLTRQALDVLGPGYELLNMGASGWNVGQELTALESWAPSVHAQRVIVVFTANDVEVTPQLRERQPYMHDLVNIRDGNLARHEAQAWYNVPSRLLRFVGSSLEMQRLRRDTIQWYKDMYDPLHNEDNLEAFADCLARMSARTDCQVVYVLYPLMEGLEGEYPLTEVHRKVGAMAQAAGLPVLDLTPAFAGQRTADLWVHDSDHHPNGKAHAIAAKAIVGWLRTLPGFLDLPPPSTPPENSAPQDRRDL